MVNKRQISKEFVDSLARIIEIEEDSSFVTGTALRSERKRLRELLLNLFENGDVKKILVPRNLEIYAGVKYSEKGRIHWREVAEELARRTRISESRFDEVADSYRGERTRRLVYGKTDDENYEDKKRQLDLFVSS